MAWILAQALLFSLMPHSAHAADTQTFDWSQITDGEAALREANRLAETEEATQFTAENRAAEVFTVLMRFCIYAAK